MPMPKLTPLPENSEAAIFARVWSQPAGGLTPVVARHILRLRFSADDEARMHELARKNRLGELTDAERNEFDNFVKVGDLLAILQSKARKALKCTTAARNGHG
jgi:hypothetical protein